MQLMMLLLRKQNRLDQASACHVPISVSCSPTGSLYLAGVHYAFREQGIPAKKMTLVARQNALRTCTSLQSASD